MKKVIITLLASLILLLVTPSIYAGDLMYHFMQAHQDYVIIGKVTDKKSNNMYEIKVSELIKESSIRTDMPKKIEVEIPRDDIEEGDCLALSLSLRGGGYRIENGYYKVTTDNTDTLEVEKLDDTDLEDELTAVELFLKSRGKIKDFYFTEGKTYVHTNSGVVSNDDICIYSPEDGKMLPTEYEKNEKYKISGWKFNIQTIIIIVLIFILVQIIVLFVYIKLNPNCKIKEFIKGSKEDKEIKSKE